MNEMKSLAELQAIRDKARAQISVREGQDDELEKRGITNVQVTQTGCIGICQFEPVIEVVTPGKDKVTYVKMTPEMAVRVVNDHIVNGNVVQEFTIGAHTK